MRPLIAIVGSGKPRRDYVPPLRQDDDLPGACADLGRELARAGFNLVAFSSDDDYVEKDVVCAFAQAAADDQYVVVRAPMRQTVRFDVPAGVADRIRIEPDVSDLWEPSFYRSVMDADGVVVVGGGRSTRIAGTIAIAQSKPIAALAWFGAGAAVIWQQMDKQPNQATRDDLHVMGTPWTATSAERIAGGLRNQLDRRRASERAEEAARRRNNRSRSIAGAGAIVLLVLAASSVLLAWAGLSTGEAIGCLLFGPLLGAVGGAMLRNTTEDEVNAIWSAARGLGAGLLTVTLYVASQLLTSPDLLTTQAVRRLLWFVLPVGVAAGYTFDLVYARLHKVNVLAAGPIENTKSDRS